MTEAISLTALALALLLASPDIVGLVRMVREPGLCWWQRVLAVALVATMVLLWTVFLLAILSSLIHRIGD